MNENDYLPRGKKVKININYCTGEYLNSAYAILKLVLY